MAKALLSIEIGCLIILGLVACLGRIPSTSVTLETVSTTPHNNQSATVSVEDFTTVKPVSTPPSFQSGSPLACLIAELPSKEGSPWETHLFDWSPDARSLAYIAPENTDADALLITGAPRFGAPKRLVSNARGDVYWSPDGSQIAFVALRPDDLETVMTIASDGSDLRDLFPGEIAQTDPGKGSKGIGGWVDRSSLWVMTNCGTGCRRLWQLNLQDGALEEVSFYSGANHAIWGSDYIWSPNRSHVVLVSGGDFQLGIRSAGGQAIQWLSGEYVGPIKTIFADWSPDSSSLLFIRLNIDGDDLPSEPPELWVWDVASSQRSLLLPGIVVASWSPSGDLIAFLALGQPSFGVDGSWQGTSAILDGPNSLGLGLYQRGEEKVIAFAPIGEMETGYRWPGQMQQQLLKPVWSPDGHYLAYRDGSSKAWILSLSELTQYQVDTKGNAVSGVRWSPDGRMLAVSTTDRLLVFAIPCTP